MVEFIIFNENDKFKMKFELKTTISELKQVISQKWNLSDKFNIFLEKYGFIDINPTLLNSQLSFLIKKVQSGKLLLIYSPSIIYILEHASINSLV